MEFACGYVYVPPLLTQREVLQSNANGKRSALLPPVTWVRPRNAPPPPPADSAKATKAEEPHIYETKIDLFEKNGKAKATKSISHHENSEFPKKPGATSSKTAVSQPTPALQKTALLPPHKKPAANTVFYITPNNINNQPHKYDEPKQEPDTNRNLLHPSYSHTVPEGSGGEVKLPADAGPVSTSVPVFIPRLLGLELMPEYLEVLPSSHLSASRSQSFPSPTLTAPSSTAKAIQNKEPLPGNPNVILVSLGKLLSEERVQLKQRNPASCFKCGSVLDSCCDNKAVKVCYFCQPKDFTNSAKPSKGSANDYWDEVFLLNPDAQSLCAAEALLLFCIDTSGSMNFISDVQNGNQGCDTARLQFVQEAVLQCVQRLSEQQPEVRVGLITFNRQVMIHGHEKCNSLLLSGDDLNDSEYLKEAAAAFPCPPPISQSKKCLQRQVMGLSANGATALGPAALLAITMASRHPGSKVIICTDGKANTKLGNLDMEEHDALTLLSSTIFYQDLGEAAANQGVTVSVLSIEGTDCRLDELGRLADRTGGKVVIANPNQLHSEFEEIIQNRTIATHCAVTLLLPKSLRMRGEKEAGHKGTREVGNVNPETEITIQFEANERDTEAPALIPGSPVFIQLQIRYMRNNGQMMLRVMTAERDITDDSSAVLSSLSLAILQLNSLQASASLAVRGRFLAAKKEGELQQKLIERAIEHNRSAVNKQASSDCLQTIEPIYKNMQNFTRNSSVISDSQSLTDAGAALLFTIKHSNRNSILLTN